LWVGSVVIAAASNPHGSARNELTKLTKLNVLLKGFAKVFADRKRL